MESKNALYQFLLTIMCFQAKKNEKRPGFYLFIGFFFCLALPCPEFSESVRWHTVLGISPLWCHSRHQNFIDTSSWLEAKNSFLNWQFSDAINHATLHHWNLRWKMKNNDLVIWEIHVKFWMCMLTVHQRIFEFSCFRGTVATEG